MKMTPSLGLICLPGLAPAFLVLAVAGPNAVYVANLLGAVSLEMNGVAYCVSAAILIAGLTLLVLSTALFLYRWTVARRLIHVLLFLILLDLFYRIAYRGPVTPGLLLAIPQTSQRETIELLAGHPALTVCLSGVALLCGLALAAGWRRSPRPSGSTCCWLAGAGLALLSFAGVHAVIWSKPVDPCCRTLKTTAAGVFPIDLAVSFGAVAMDFYRTERQNAARVAFHFPNVRLTDSARRQQREVYVVVVGETSRRQNWSLYGYSRQTNPHLEAIGGDLVPYRMMSNATNTVLSLPMALTRATPTSRDRIGTEKSIVALLQQAGFETFWISNQERPALSSNPILKIAMEAEHVSFRGEGLAAANPDRFDTNLLERLANAMGTMPQSGKAAIFLHMEGSHFSYKERYPPTFERFANTESSSATLPDAQRQLIDQYDNTIVLTDFVLSRVVDKLSACACTAGMLFFSDHGERLFDRGSTDSEFGHGFPGVARQEIEIPFVAWLSASFQRTNPLLSLRLRANARSVAELHNVFETIVDLAGVDYDDRAGTLSLFSDGWRSPSGVSVLSLDDNVAMLPVG